MSLFRAAKDQDTHQDKELNNFLLRLHFFLCYCTLKPNRLLGNLLQMAFLMLDLRQSLFMHFELSFGFFIKVFHTPLMVMSMSQSVPVLGQGGEDLQDDLGGLSL
jgi:hypothetical protein